jgi:hypothetical protein
MDDEVVGKIRGVVAGARWREADVVYLFAQARKLIERVTNAERPSYARLNFYCDWCLHSKIDRSEAGARILSRLHGIVVEHMKKTDTDALIVELSAALSLGDVRNELNALVRRYSGEAESVDRAVWRAIVPVLLEVVSQIPLEIGVKNGRLKKLDAQMRARPIKGTSVVEQLAVVKVASSLLKRNAASGEITFCMQLTTSDTTKIVAPISPL